MVLLDGINVSNKANSVSAVHPEEPVGIIAQTPKNGSTQRCFTTAQFQELKSKSIELTENPDLRHSLSWKSEVQSLIDTLDPTCADTDEVALAFKVGIALNNPKHIEEILWTIE